MIMPKQFAEHMHDLGQCIPGYALPEKEVKEFIDSATSAELQEGIMLALKTKTIWNAGLLEQALTALNIRLQVETALATDKHLKQIEQLNALTSTHIEHTKTLTKQTDKLVTESSNLSRLTKVLIWLTVALGLFAVIQIVLMVYDIWKHK